MSSTTARIHSNLKWALATLFLNVAMSGLTRGDDSESKVVDARSFRGKAMCGYQGWFRCPGDPAKLGWRHWSRDSRRISPRTLTFEMWPDLTEYGPSERYPAPGFTYPDGKPAELFSSDNAATVQRHFDWMRDYGIDGAWLQHFAVDLPGGLSPENYPSRRRVLEYVRDAAERSGRVWALSYDISAMPTDRIFEVVTSDWKRLVDEKITQNPRYLQNAEKPVVQIWGFYYKNEHNHMTAKLANQLIDFFKTPGPYAAFLVAGGDWNWRHIPDPEWQTFFRRFDAYSPWNVGNHVRDRSGVHHASTKFWAEDRRECEERGPVWLPVVYPGFSWDNLQRKPAGTSTIPRNGGRFFWEQFHELRKLGVDTVYVAMFDEVDEGTAIFKVTDSPPTEAHFVGLEGLPSDWYLRLAGAGAKMIRKQTPASAEIPIKP